MANTMTLTRPELLPLTAELAPSDTLRECDRNWLRPLVRFDRIDDWTLEKAVCELSSNMLDQAKSVGEHFVSADDWLQFTEEPGRLYVHIGTTLLAEARWGTDRRYNEIRSAFGNTSPGSEVAETQFLEWILYGSNFSLEVLKEAFPSRLKMACAVLCRQGCETIIDCKQSQYCANIVRDLSPGNVYVQLVQEADNTGLPNYSVRFTILFGPDKTVANMQRLLQGLWLSPAALSAGVPTSHGVLLRDPAMRGKYFYRGVLINEIPNCLFGYSVDDPSIMAPRHHAFLLS